MPHFPRLLTYLLLLSLLGGLVACSEDETQPATPIDTASAEEVGDTQSDATPEAPFAGYESDIYSNTERWLCHPSRSDGPCHDNLDATHVLADGSTEVETFVAAENPAVDCFYVYPTVSLDGSPNSDWETSEEEEFAVRSQAARLQTLCRVYAPVYRQGTITALLSQNPPGDFELAYADVADAFKHYMANHNEGRGFVLIGHSQGTRHLRQLIQEEIDAYDALRDQLIAAYLVGMTVAVPEGADVGGDFQNLPLCRKSDQIGCVVSYATYRATEPPEEGALFGKVYEGGGMAACNNPAALEGGKVLLSPAFPSEIPALLDAFIQGPNHPFADPETAPALEGGFFVLPDFLDGECVVRDGYSYLEISIRADPEDPRVDDIGGDFAPGWGLHLVDISVVLGDIEEVLSQQVNAYINHASSGSDSP